MNKNISDKKCVYCDKPYAKDGILKLCEDHHPDKMNKHIIELEKINKDQANRICEFLKFENRIKSLYRKNGNITKDEIKESLNFRAQQK